MDTQSHIRHTVSYGLLVRRVECEDHVPGGAALPALQPDQQPEQGRHAGRGLHLHTGRERLPRGGVVLQQSKCSILQVGRTI